MTKTGCSLRAFTVSRGMFKLDRRDCVWPVAACLGLLLAFAAGSAVSAAALHDGYWSPELDSLGPACGLQVHRELIRIQDGRFGWTFQTRRASLSDWRRNHLSMRGQISSNGKLSAVGNISGESRAAANGPGNTPEYVMTGRVDDSNNEISVTLLEKHANCVKQIKLLRIE